MAEESRSARRRSRESGTLGAGTVNWYGESIGELRAERGVVVHAAPPGE